MNRLQNLRLRLREAATDGVNRTAFLSSLAFGLLSYLYLMVGNLNNHDNISQTPAGYGFGITCGRWLVTGLGTLINKLWGNYNIPFFNTLIAILLLCLTSVLLVKIFGVRSKSLAFLISTITVVFPTIADTLLFSFISHYYVLGIFLLALGVLLAIQKKWGWWIVAAGSIACALGLYQGFFPYVAALMILCLIRQCLQKEVSAKQTVFFALRLLGILIAGYLLYILLRNLFLAINHEVVSDYYDANLIAGSVFSQFSAIVKSIYYNFYLLPTHGYVSITSTVTIRIVIALLFLLTALVLVFQWRERRIGKILELLLGLVLLPVAANISAVMTTAGGLYTLMCFGLLSVFYLPIIVVGEIGFTKESFRRAAVAALCVLVTTASVNYSWQSNGNYRKLYYTNRQMENYFVVMFTRIQSLEGYRDDMEVLFVGGEIQDESFSSPWEDTPFTYSAGHDATAGINMYSRGAYIQNYLGYSCRDATEEETARYAADTADMAAYPDDGSLKIVGDAVLVRLS